MEVVGHRCDAPASVIVHSGDTNIRLPIIDDGVTVYERKDGPLSFSRRAEVDFPIEAFGTDWSNYIDGFHASASFQEASVWMRKMDNKGTFIDEEVPVMRGYIGAVGSSGTNTGHITIFGPYNLLSHMSSAKSLEPRIRYHDVIEWFVEELNTRQGIISDVEPVYPSLDEINSYIEQQRDSYGPFDQEVTSGEPRGGNIELQQATQRGSDNIPSWNPNRDTMADVARWLQETFNFYFYFDVNEDNDLELVAQFNRGNQYDTTNNDDPDIIQNNAVFEMKPFNSVIIKGDKLQTRASLLISGTEEEQIAAIQDGYPRAIAWHPPLVERAGDLIPTQRTVGETSLSDAAKTAQQELKRSLDAVSGGTMNFALWPQVQTHDRIEARPACNSLINTDVPSLNYEVQRVAHTVAPSSDNIPTTEVSVSMAVDPAEIRHYSTAIAKMPSKELENEPVDEPEWIPELEITD